MLVRDADPEDVCGQLKGRLQASPALDGRCTRAALIAWPAPPARRFWSPCLDLTLRAHPQGTLLIGRFGPQPMLFTAFLFGSIGLTFLAVIAACWSFVQLSLDQTPTALLGLLPPLVGGVGMIVVDAVGRRLARSQMGELAALLEGVGEVRDDEEGLLAEVERHRWTEDGKERRLRSFTPP